MNTRQLFELRKEAYTNGYMQTNPDGDVNAYINDVIMGSNTVLLIMNSMPTTIIKIMIGWML